MWGWFERVEGGVVISGVDNVIDCLVLVLSRSKHIRGGVWAGDGGEPHVFKYFIVNFVVVFVLLLPARQGQSFLAIWN